VVIKTCYEVSGWFLSGCILDDEKIVKMRSLEEIFKWRKKA
jgi:hypothetical protein